MTYELKKAIKSNILFYIIWFYLYRIHVGIRPKFFNKKTNVYVDGFQRSGNTFLIYILEKCFANVSMVHHLHAVAPIKIALHNNIPTFILIRNPQDVIPSSYLKSYSTLGLPKDINIRLITDLTKDYFDYYTFVLKNIKRVTVLDFSILIKDPFEIMSLMTNQLESKYHKMELQEIIKYNVPLFKGAIDPLGASLPTQEKEDRKKELKAILKNSGYFRKTE